MGIVEPSHSLLHYQVHCNRPLVEGHSSRAGTAAVIRYQSRWNTYQATSKSTYVISTRLSLVSFAPMRLLSIDATDSALLSFCIQAGVFSK